MRSMSGLLRIGTNQCVERSVVKKWSALRRGWHAIEVIVLKKTVRVLIPELKAAGAQGIIEYPLNKLIM